MGLISALLFLLAIRIRHPFLIAGSSIAMIVTYIRFRNNYLLYKRKQAKLKRQSSAITVSTYEQKDSENPNV